MVKAKVTSERPAKTGGIVKGREGTLYKSPDEPGVVYVVGKGFYWSGPIEETEEIVSPPRVKTVNTPFGSVNVSTGVATSGYLINAATAKWMDAYFNHPVPNVYRSHYYTLPPMKTGDSVQVEYTVDYYEDDDAV